MRTIQVSGSPFEMGFQQGKETAEFWNLRAKSAVGAEMPRGFEDALGKYCPRQLTRLIGLARGAAVSLETALSYEVEEIILSQVDYYIGGCSAFALGKGAFPDSAPIIAKNFDGRVTAQNPQIVRVSRPEEGYASIDVTSALSGGLHEGVNEKGLAITYNHGHGIDKPTALLPIPILIQETLEQFDTVDQAIDFLANVPRGGDALIMIADSQGDVASLELSPHYASVRRAEKGRVGHTNHYHTPQMAAIDVPYDAHYSDKTPGQLRGVRIRESSEMRYARLKELLDKNESFDFDRVKTALADHGEDDMPSDNTICRHGAYYETTLSFVLYTKPPKIIISEGLPCKAFYSEITF